jgi:signal transduction histidine kinase
LGRLQTRLGLLFLLFLSLSQCFGNQKATRIINPTDSVELLLKQVRFDNKLTIYQKQKNLDKALKLALKSNPSNLSKISSTALVSGDSALFRIYNKKVITLSSKLKEGKSHAFAHWDLADFLRKTSPDSAFYNYQEALSVFSKIDLDENSNHYPGNLLVTIGNLKDKIKDYVGAEKSHIAAIKYFEEVNRKDKLTHAYNSLGIAQNGMRKFDEAIKFYKKAREYIPEIDANRQNQAYRSNENNIASAHLRKGDFKKAFALFSQLKEKDSFSEKFSSLYPIVLGSWAYSGFKSGSTDYSTYSEALEKSNRLLDSLNNKEGKARNYEYYAELLNSQKKIDLAIENALMAKKIAEETNNNDRLLSSLKLLISLDTLNSSKYGSTYINLNESLQQQERTIQDKFARIEMETDEVIEENESLAKQRETLIGISIGLLLLGLGTFIIISQRVNNQHLKFQQSQQESNQEIYNLMLSQQGKFQEGKQLEQKRISEEIHDGILGQMLGIRLILSGLNERNDESAITQRADLIEKLRELEEEIRTISHELNSAAYKKINNFIIAIKDLISTVSTSSKIAIRFEFTETYDWDNLEGDIKINTYRITQECLQNCVKHAKCKNISVILNLNGDKILLKIVDDGIGFNAKKGRKGIGLKNIISRIEKIDGDLNIESTIGKGTEMIITVPLFHTNIEKKQAIFKEKETLEA